MKRYLDEENFQRLKEDFRPVVERIIESHGEYDLRLRDNYFNIYCRGNSLAKVEFRTEGVFEISINKRFAQGVFDSDQRFADRKESRDMLVWRISSRHVNPFFQKKYLNALAKNIDFVDHSEEINFEQQIIADNWNNPKWFIIDRQIQHPGRRDDKIDLLALVRSKDTGEFNFHVIEVKMGNNPELKKDVASQLDRYLLLVKKNLEVWKQSYRKAVEQLHAVGFYELLDPASLTIGSRVTGSILAFGYPRVARAAVEELKKNRPDLTVKLFSFELE
jgi:hypothetical protein